MLSIIVITHVDIKKSSSAFDQVVMIIIYYYSFYDVVH